MAEEIIHNHIPPELDAGLSPTDLGKAVLVRSGRWDLLEKLVAIDAGLYRHQYRHFIALDRREPVPQS